MDIETVTLFNIINAITMINDVIMMSLKPIFGNYKTLYVQFCLCHYCPI